MTQQQINDLPTDVLIEGDWATREVYVDGFFLDPKPSQKVWNHSPDGFNWSYGGSGPAQLALAIMLRYLPAKEAQMVYQTFKFQHVGGWPQGDFEVLVNIREFVQANADRVLNITYP